MRLRRLLDVAGLAVDDVRCDGGARAWSEGESCVDALVLVRSGCFRRRVDGRDSLLDPAVLYVQAPGEEQQFAHPHTGGDACTVIRVARELPVLTLGGLALRELFGALAAGNADGHADCVRVS
jgi:hypothetical protein